MSNEIIRASHIQKIYQLYKKPKDRLKEAFSLTRKNYHSDFYALQDINFTVREGECFGIIGKNGSGKSTLLKIITGVLSKTSGDLEINGRISALLELGAGFNQEYTGIENIYLNGDIMGFSREEIAEKVPTILEFADIGDHVYQPVKTYSSGMFVRLAFALAINVEPEILIVDEALSVGDAFFQLKCYKKFAEFKEKGKTIVFVTHDLSSVIKYCDRVMVINNGEQVALGSSREMVDLYKRILVNQNDNDVKEQEQIADKNLSSNIALSEKILEYGTKDAEIVDIRFEDAQGNACQQIEKFNEISFCFKVKFYKEIHNPIFAFTIKNVKGSEICGTNNMSEKMHGFVASEGDVYEISFTQKIPLQSGYYFISLGCTGLDRLGNLVVYHRLYDVAEISVMSDKTTVGYFDLDSKVSIQKSLESNLKK
ncbi:teichoic acid transport system ATP-binding protein [Eubacterium aggregans]|uniref:Teichoic acid transport system ATP-binding protein n=1 Tax=Eubacterium aggregans TaxID=81409 RepID=A0A1H4D409_9FIRM|nr:ABC transporter ATP-binding protein [Eubacterium aggregans]SEA67179.1 teichoic acid transport system ATP-binding protein [Eubacterium aggregans]